MSVQSGQEESSDPYSDYRDENGRFMEGNPGGPGGEREGAGGKRENAGRKKGSYTDYIPGKKAAKKWNILIELPPRCPCGNRDFRYKKEANVFLARCNECHDVFVYDSLTRRWTQEQTEPSQVGKR